MGKLRQGEPSCACHVESHIWIESRGSPPSCGALNGRWGEHPNCGAPLQDPAWKPGGSWCETAGNGSWRGWKFTSPIPPSHHCLHGPSQGLCPRVKGCGRPPGRRECGNVGMRECRTETQNLSAGAPGLGIRLQRGGPSAAG